MFWRASGAAAAPPVRPDGRQGSQARAHRNGRSRALDIGGHPRSTTAGEFARCAPHRSWCRCTRCEWRGGSSSLTDMMDRQWALLRYRWPTKMIGHPIAQTLRRALFTCVSTIVIGVAAEDAPAAWQAVLPLAAP